MAKINSLRGGCKDVFKSFLYENVTFDGYIQIPRIKGGLFRPGRLISFSQAISSTDCDCWVHFYEDDYLFERIWNNPRKYLPILKRYNGVISPDFSLYRDMPLTNQLWNIFRGRLIGCWLQNNGVNVIPNIRFSDSRSYTAACSGVESGNTIAVGSHGCLKCKDDRDEFKNGLYYVVETLKPKIIVVYGSAPEDIFASIKDKNIEVLDFPCENYVFRAKEVR